LLSKRFRNVKRTENERLEKRVDERTRDFEAVLKGKNEER